MLLSGKKAFHSIGIVLAVFAFVLVASGHADAAGLRVMLSPNSIDAQNAHRVTVTATLTGEDGRGISGRSEDIRFFSSFGNFNSTIEDLGSGQYRTFLEVPELPPPRRPAYLFVLATARLGNETIAGRAVGGITSNLELNGTSAAGVHITARAGGQTLGGAAIAGPGGKFHLVAPIPPRADFVDIVVSSGGKEISTQNLDLKTDPARRIFVRPVPDRVKTGGDPALVFFMLINKDGDFDDTDSYSLNCDPGACSTPVKIEPGLFRAVFTPPRTLTAENALMTVKYSGAAGSAHCAIVPSGLAEIHITAPAGVFAGQDIPLTITPVDFLDLGIPNMDVEIYAESTLIAKVKTRGDGSAQASHKTTFSQTGDITFMARAADPGAPDRVVESQHATVRIKESKIELKASADTAAVGPGKQANVEVAAAFAQTSSPVDGLTLSVRPEAGTTGPVQAAGNGTYYFLFTAPQSHAADSIRIEIDSPDAPTTKPAELVLKWSGPMPAQLSVSASPAAAAAGDTIAVAAALTDENGAPVIGQAVTLSAPAGRFNAVSDAGDGRYTSALTIPESATPGPLDITAVCECGGKNFTAQTQIQIQPMPPASIELTADKDSLYISDSLSVQIDILVKNKAGEAMPNETVSVTLADGSETKTLSLTTDASGRAQTTLNLAAAAGQASVTAAAGGISQSVSIQKLKHPVTRLELTAADAEVPADGVSVVEVEVLAFDATGRDAVNERIDFTLRDGSGRISAAYCTTGDDGRCSVYYTAGVSCGSVDIEAFAYEFDTVRKSIQITETPKIPATLTQNGTAPTDLLANGTDIWDISVTAKDAGACEIPGETLTFSVTNGAGGVAAAAVTDSAGAAAARYTTGLDPGTVTILARSVTSPMIALQTQVEVLPWRPSSYRLEPSTLAPSAGQTFNLTITALDSHGSTLTSFDTSELAYVFSGPSAAPDGSSPSYPNTTIILAAFNNGVAVVPVKLYRAESVALAVDDGYATGVSSMLNVLAANPATISAQAASSAQTAGVPFSVTLTVKDTYQNVVTWYDPSGKNYSFSGPASSPGGSAPSYPSSAATRAAFSNGAATVNVTLYKAETAALSVGDGSVSGNTGSITVSRNVTDAIAVASGNNQSVTITTAMSTLPVVRVTDAYGNPVQGEAVTFTLTTAVGAGGSITGTSKTSNSSGNASMDSWTMGNATGANQVTASITTGTTTSAVITANAVVPSPTANITLQSPSSHICPGADTADTIDLNGNTSTASAVSSITTYSWDFDSGAGSLTTIADPTPLSFNATGTYEVRLTVTDNFLQTDTDSYWVNVGHVPGPLSLSASDSSIDNMGDNTDIESGTIYGCGFVPVADGMLFTVNTSLGRITDSDANAAAGIQVETDGGKITFNLQSEADAGTATVSAESVEFTSQLTDTVNVTIKSEENIPPYVVSFSPSGDIGGDIASIQVVFSENVTMDTSSDFTVKQGGPSVPGSWSYNSGTRMATFTPTGVLNVDAQEVDVTVKRSIEDSQGAGLDGTYVFDGSDSDFTFTFGNTLGCTSPTSSNCSVSASPFSPDPSDGLPDTAVFQFDINDNFYLDAWSIEILDGATLVRTLVKSNSECCNTQCANPGMPACVACCGGANGCCTDVTAGMATWDGKDQSGNYAANGTYTYRVIPYDLLKCTPVAPCTGSVAVNNPITFGGFGP